MFELFKEIKNFLPYDYDEAECKRKFLNFLLDNSNCFSRSNLIGHVTAGGLVCDGKGNILLNHHKASGMWFQFGGHSDGCEDLLRVAKREIKEESGLTDIELGVDGIFNLDIVKVPARPNKNEPEHFHYDVNFMFITNNKNFQMSDESMEIKWVTINEAKRLVNPLDKGMLRMIDKYEDYLDNKMQSSKKQ